MLRNMRASSQGLTSRVDKQDSRQSWVTTSLVLELRSNLLFPITILETTTVKICKKINASNQSRFQRLEFLMMPLLQTRSSIQKAKTRSIMRWWSSMFHLFKTQRELLMNTQAPFSWTVPILSHHTMFVKTLFSQLHWWSTWLFLENWWLEWRSTMILWDQFFPTWTSSSKLQSPTTRSMSSTHSPDKDKHWSIFWRLPLESKLMMPLC